MTTLFAQSETAADPEGTRFRAQVRAWCEQHLPRHVRDKVQANLFLDKDDYLAYLHALIPQGWVAGHWPRELGGCGWTDVAAGIAHGR